jgi:signal transduction histidine kinase
VTVLDPREIRSNPRPPPVQVEGIVADRKDYAVSSGVRLPALVRDLRIDYTATSLVAPEKIQFKYILEGRDRDWTEAGNRRRAFYTDLDPGDYRFRVIASNNSGVWNVQGASLEFSVAPAYWQTWWFRALCAMALAALLWTFYRWRVRQITREVSMTLDARVAERTRIARELHDTLLQSFNAVLLRLQTSVRLWPAEQGRGILEETIEQAAAAITEGRDAVQDLRGSAGDAAELADALRALGETLTVGTAPDATLLTVEVEGRARALHPVVRDDVLQIAGEALRNAVRHAHATRIEVQVRYDERELRVSVRDDGKGMEAAISRAGREGHFGLRGMRERSQLIGAKLTFWSRPGSGTEVELRVPAARAYASSADDEPLEVADEARPRGRAGASVDGNGTSPHPRPVRRRPPTYAPGHRGPRAHRSRYGARRRGGDRSPGHRAVSRASARHHADGPADAGDGRAGRDRRHPRRVSRSADHRPHHLRRRCAGAARIAGGCPRLSAQERGAPGADRDHPCRPFRPKSGVAGHFVHAG